MVGYTPSSFTDLVFAGERIDVSPKRGKFNHPAWTDEKLGQMKRVTGVMKGLMVLRALEPVWQEQVLKVQVLLGLWGLQLVIELKW